MPNTEANIFWNGQPERLELFIETEPMQYDLHLEGELIADISAIGADIEAWAVGYTFPYLYKSKNRKFVVERWAPEGGRMGSTSGLYARKSFVFCPIVYVTN